MPHHHRFKAIAIDASNFAFSVTMLEYEFPKKFVIPTFGCYFGQSDPVQHLRQYQNKMVIHSRNDSILCLIFPSNLKGVAFDWFHFLPSRSIRSFGDLTKMFLYQYSSRQEFKQDTRHLLH